MLKEFDSTLNEIEWPNSEFCNAVTTGEARQLLFERMKMTLTAYLPNLTEKTYNKISNVLYHQPLPITRHQERFYADNYFD